MKAVNDTTRDRPAGAREVELDVREDLRQGREPFARIMAAVAALGEGEVLHLRSPFEPVPLFNVLGKRGFAHESQAHAPDDWSSWFWKQPAPDEAPAAPTAAGAPPDAAATEHWLDVRGLQPPEPLQRTLAALETLPPGHTLLHLNTRVPQLLFPMLAEQGFACTVDDSQPERVLVRIWRR